MRDVGLEDRKKSNSLSLTLIDGSGCSQLRRSGC